MHAAEVARRAGGVGEVDRGGQEGVWPARVGEEAQATRLPRADRKGVVVGGQRGVVVEGDGANLNWIYLSLLMLARQNYSVMDLFSVASVQL